MKNLEMIFNNDDASINYNIELIDMWKERINPDVDKLKDEATKISKDVKYLKGFEKFVIDIWSPVLYVQVITKKLKFYMMNVIQFLKHGQNSMYYF